MVRQSDGSSLDVSQDGSNPGSRHAAQRRCAVLRRRGRWRAGGAGDELALRRQGIDHVVLEADRVGHEWRDRRWDSFCLVTPNWQCRLPGFPYEGTDPGRVHGPRRDRPATWRTTPARSTPPLVEGVASPAATRTGRRVPDRHDARRPSPPTRWWWRPGRTTRPRCRGWPSGCRARSCSCTPRSTAARSSCRTARSLVVGTGQSGCQIAEDLHLAGRQVHLAVGSAPRVARFYRGPRLRGLAGRDGLLRQGHRRVRRRRRGPVPGQPLRHRPRRRPRHRPAGLRPGGDAAVRAADRRVDRSALRFAADLRPNLDHADAVAEGIKDAIDAYIAARGIEAPARGPVRPVWKPRRGAGDPGSTAGGSAR